MSTTLTNPKNNEVITSPFNSDAEAKEALVAKIASGEFSDPSFARSLIEAYPNNLTPARLFWFHKLAMPKVAPAPAAQIDLSGIKNLFIKAASALKRPAVILSAASGNKVKISFAGERSKYVGNLMVSSPTYGGAYYGRVTDSGEFFAGRDKDSTVVDLLKDFAADPAKVAAEYGHRTGCCCFCSRGLDDERSTDVGYGPICAKRFGLPWGAKPKAAAVVVPDLEETRAMSEAMGAAA